jgi:hypothetical protein
MNRKDSTTFFLICPLELRKEEDYDCLNCGDLGSTAVIHTPPRDGSKAA